MEGKEKQVRYFLIPVSWKTVGPKEETALFSGEFPPQKHEISLTFFTEIGKMSLVRFVRTPLAPEEGWNLAVSI